MKWHELPRPIVALAPMEDVTDTVFRQIVVSTSKPDVMFTEFVNVDGLVSDGRHALLSKLRFSPMERPIIAQVWGTNPNNFAVVSKHIQSMGFDGIDVNMGCPQKDVVNKGACAGLIKNPSLAKEIIESVRSSVPNLPLSVKTRIGFSHIQTEEWIGFLLTLKLDALIVHGRTVKEMSKVPAHWDEIARVVKLKRRISPDTIIIGNGDVGGYAEVLSRVRETHVDGVMIGRGIFTNPWIFDRSQTIQKRDVSTHLALCKKHLALFESTWRKEKPFSTMKKFFKMYINGFDNARLWRQRLMETRSVEEAQRIITQFQS